MVYSTNPTTLQELQQEIEQSHAAVPAAALVSVSQLLTAVNCALKLTVIILNSFTGFANSLSASHDL
jgi:hypothetical protein